MAKNMATFRGFLNASLLQLLDIKLVYFDTRHLRAIYTRVADHDCRKMTSNDTMFTNLFKALSTGEEKQKEPKSV